MSYDNLLIHKIMIEDKDRCEKYCRAIKRTVKKGDIVVDLGCGTGILSFFACQAKAKKVYAIEQGEIISLARRIAKKNNFLDRIEFIKGKSFDVKIPERCDVFISEMIGDFALAEDLLNITLDAKKRFLKANGKMIPQAIRLVVAPINSKALYDNLDFWSKSRWGIDFSACREYASQDVYHIDRNTRNKKVKFISKPSLLKRIDLTKLKQDEFKAQVAFKVNRRTLLHGFLGWFEAELCKDIVLSTKWPAPKSHWAPLFFPLAKPIFIKQGLTVNFKVKMLRHLGSFHWRWQTLVNSSSANRAATFKHSTIKSIVLDIDRIKRYDLKRKALISLKSAPEALILKMANGRNELQAIAKKLKAKFPKLYSTFDRALVKVIRVINEYEKK